MAIEPIKNNPQTRFTKKGNSYQKTNTGKLIGSGLAAAYVAGTALRPSFREAMKETFEGISQYAPKEYAGKSKAATVAVLALSAAIIVGAGTGLGAIVDAVINKVKAIKADKEPKNTTHG